MARIRQEVGEFHLICFHCHMQVHMAVTIRKEMPGNILGMYNMMLRD